MMVLWLARKNRYDSVGFCLKGRIQSIKRKGTKALTDCVVCVTTATLRNGATRAGLRFFFFLSFFVFIGSKVRSVVAVVVVVV